MSFERQPPIPLSPASDREFFATALKLRVTFEPPETDRPSSMTVVQSGKAINLMRTGEA